MQIPGSPNGPPMVDGWVVVSVLGSPPINNLLRPCNQSKIGQNGPNGVRILLRHNEHFISVHLWNRLSTFIPKHFLQNLKNPLVAKLTIYGRTLGGPVDSCVAFGDRATVFQQHCTSAQFNSLWPSDTIKRLKFRTTFAQIMACCLARSSHYLNQCLLVISKAQWHASQDNFTRDTTGTDLYN